jgi:15-cis-phytoene synthase / lycopene beta-cyclase
MRLCELESCEKAVCLADGSSRHLKYTIPPAIALTLIYRPLCTRLDIYRVLFLIGVAVVATTPWDSYLIRHGIWAYPPGVIIGPTLFSIPSEEIFFFVVQTYNTSLLYLLLSKLTFMPSHLVQTAKKKCRKPTCLKNGKVVGQVIISIAVLSGATLLSRGGEGTYLGLILIWAGPFALLLWTLTYRFLINLSFINTVVPIMVPTVYLWVVDTLALRRGTWTIESGTKLGIYVWDGLEAEEAVFFLVTNILIVFGLVAFDNALAVLDAFPRLFPEPSAFPPPIILLRALLTNPEKYDSRRILGIQEAVERLREKSRSFYLASSVFSGRLRIDLILL